MKRVVAVFFVVASVLASVSSGFAEGDSKTYLHVGSGTIVGGQLGKVLTVVKTEK
jgi:hypothetical protein